MPLAGRNCIAKHQLEVKNRLKTQNSGIMVGNIGKADATCKRSAK